MITMRKGLLVGTDPSLRNYGGGLRVRRILPLHWRRWVSKQRYRTRRSWADPFSIRAGRSLRPLRKLSSHPRSGQRCAQTAGDARNYGSAHRALGEERLRPLGTGPPSGPVPRRHVRLWLRSQARRTGSGAGAEEGIPGLGLARETAPKVVAVTFQSLHRPRLITCTSPRVIRLLLGGSPEAGATWCARKARKPAAGHE
jgi:hypothetical protein